LTNPHDNAVTVDFPAVRVAFALPSRMVLG
jgi:hypothetical protein